MYFTEIWPEISLIIGVLAITLFGVIGRKLFSYKASYYLALVILITTFCLNNNLFAEIYSDSSDRLINTNYLVISFRTIVIIFAFFSLLLMKGLSGQYKNLQKFEVNILVLIAVLGGMVMISSNNLLSLYIGAELQSLSLYCLTALNKNSAKSSEAAMKYFILGAVSSAVMLFGMSFIYGYTGSIDYSVIQQMYLSEGGSHVIPSALTVGLVLVLSALLFKIAAAPFHVWSPDVYEGSIIPITGFFALVPKIVGVFVVLKFVLLDFSIWFEQLSQILIIVAILSMFLGSISAIKQNEFKRLIAYSSIANIGFILAGFLGNNSESISAVLIYSIIYGVSTLGAFAAVSMLRTSDDGDVYSLSMFKGLGKSNPIFAMSLSAILLSMAGIPPLAGFIAKFVIIKELVNSEYFVIAVLFVIASVISAFYYIRIIKLMYFDASSSTAVKLNYCNSNVAIATIALVIIMVMIFLPSSITNFAEVNASYFQ